MPINVTKTFLPPFEEYTAILERAWNNNWITNNGELLLELEAKLRSLLGVKHLWFCNNGTSVLQIALKALNITREVITTPFSYVATTTSIVWENCTPVFVDINENDFCIDPSKIEKAITPRSEAILVTHVYGYPCDVDCIDAIAKKHNLKVIYDAAHAFGTNINGRSLLSYGDISTCSFHATKLFHTGEGGCLVTNDEELARQMFLYRQFGHINDDYFSMGINAKNSELHAAMGLCNLNHISEIMARRKTQWLYYKDRLKDSDYQTLNIDERVDYNYAYFPLVFSSEEDLLNTLKILKERDVLPRRYFYPSLNTLPYLKSQSCPVSESIAQRVVCLPLFYDLKEKDQEMISELLMKCEISNK